MGNYKKTTHVARSEITPGKSPDFAATRTADLDLLRDILEQGEEKLGESFVAFEDMQDKLRKNLDWTLNKAQREWAMKVLDRPVYENLMSNGLAPRGREVETVAVLKRENLPLKPPRRK